MTKPPEVWLEGYNAAPRRCDDTGSSRTFEKIYRSKVDKKVAWVVHVVVRVACSEEIAIQYLERHCLEGHLYSPKNALEITADKLGRICMSPIVPPLRSSSFRSFLGMQSGLLSISVYEANYVGAEVAKQIVIDDLAARLRTANEQAQSKILSEP